MKSTVRLFIAVMALLIAAPALFAQTPEASTLQVTQPLNVGGTVLQPGMYTIYVVRSFHDRDVVQVTSPDRQKVYATVLTVPHPFKPGEDTSHSEFIYYPANADRVAALRTWYAPHPDASLGGHDVVYDKEHALQIAKQINEPVVTYTGQTSVAELNTEPELQVTTPQNTLETYTPPTQPMTSSTTTETTMMETPAPAPSMTTESKTTEVAESRPMDMPRTASDLPLMALLGLASIGGAVALRFGRTE